MSKTSRYFHLLWVLVCGLALALPTAFAASASPVDLTGALHWRSVGPYQGGVVIAVTGVATEPNVFYMGSTGGGVWRSNNYGQTWKNISDKDFDNNNIGAIAVAPSNPKIIYVGTGNPDIRNTMLTGDGMYKSTDGGKTWNKDGLADTHIISRILVDPNNPEVVYAAAMGHVFAPNSERGVYKSTDGGATWKKILFINDKTGAIDLAMDPQNPEVIYAAMWQAYRRLWMFSSGGPGSGLYKSTDGGSTWTNITHNAGLPKGIFGRIGVAVAPSDPNVLYTVVQANFPPDNVGGLFRSSDGGRNWKLVNTNQNITERAFYYTQVFVDPKDPNTVYLPEVSGTWVSHDGGKTISVLHLPHGDNHSLWINPNHPNIMISGNDGGASVTLNTGENWSSRFNQPTAQMYHVNLDNQFPFWIYGSQQDSGTSVGPSAVRAGSIPAKWTTVAGNENSWIVPVPGKPWITISSGNAYPLFRDNRKTGVVKSISPWPDYKYGIMPSKQKYRFGWLHHPIRFAPGNPNVLLIGANVVFESHDLGDHWTKISPDLTRHDISKLDKRSGGPITADEAGQQIYDVISALAVSPVNVNIFWTGSDDGLVYVTTDAGGHWDEVRPPSLPTWSVITSIEPSHTEAGTAYVSASRFQWDDFHPYVFKTTDYGKHWTKIISGLPDDQYVNSVRQDPDDPGLLFAGTSSTVYASLDDGGQWFPLKLNLPVVRVNDIAIQPQQHAVVLATFGRSFWVLDNLQFLEQLSTAQVPSNSMYLFKPQQTWLVTRNMRSFGGASEGGEDLAPGATVFFHLPTDYAGQPVRLTFTTLSGDVISSFVLPQTDKKTGKPEEQMHPGMNRFLWNLRYPNAVDVKGIFNTFAFGAAAPIGPEVVPGTYEVDLAYGGNTQKQSFVVKLDPRLDTTQAQLQSRFDLLMKVHAAVNSLDIALNEAIDSREQLSQAVAAGNVSKGSASKAMQSLNDDIDSLVDLRIQSSEGAIVFPAKLRAWLTNIAGDIGMSFTPPTTAQEQVAAEFIEQAQAGVSHLHRDTANAQTLLKR